MVEKLNASVLTRATPTQVDHGVRVSSFDRHALHPSHDDGHVAVRHAIHTTAIGPEFVGPVVMASRGDLIVIGHVAHQTLQVWRGSGSRLTKVTEFEAPVTAGGLISLVRHRDEWHLFARHTDGRSAHFVSTDLYQWSPRSALAHSFPAFAVSGAAVGRDGLLLAGRIYVDEMPFGWGLLCSDGRTFEARPVPLPLATQLRVVGPVIDHAGHTVLLLDSGHNRTIATSDGQGWVLTTVLPAVVPTASFVDGADLWLVGQDGVDGSPVLARLDHDEIVPLPDDTLGSISAALVHADHVVLARDC